MQSIVRDTCFVLLVVFASPVLLCGCGDSVPRGGAEVSGSVTYNGEPLPDGSVVFYKGPETAGVGAISGGQYAVRKSANSAGMEPGTYQVVIESWEVEPNSVTEEGEIIVQGKTRIPESYGDVTKSGLTATVDPGNNVVNFDLKPE